MQHSSNGCKRITRVHRRGNYNVIKMLTKDAPKLMMRLNIAFTSDFNANNK